MTAAGKKKKLYTVNSFFLGKPVETALRGALTFWAHASCK